MKWISEKKFEFDNHISNIDELIHQLKSLKEDAFYNLCAENIDIKTKDEIFSKDFHALSIVIKFLEEVK